MTSCPRDCCARRDARRWREAEASPQRKRGRRSDSAASNALRGLSVRWPCTHGPVHHLPDPVFHAPGCLPPGRPDRLENGDHVGAGHVAGPHVADERVGRRRRSTGKRPSNGACRLAFGTESPQDPSNIARQVGHDATEHESAGITANDRRCVRHLAPAWVWRKPTELEG